MLRIETSYLVCTAIKLTGFYLMDILNLNEFEFFEILYKNYSFCDIMYFMQKLLTSKKSFDVFVHKILSCMMRNQFTYLKKLSTLVVHVIVHEILGLGWVNFLTDFFHNLSKPKKISWINHFKLMFQYISITPEKVRKPEIFLTFSRGIEIEKWLEMVNWG